MQKSLLLEALEIVTCHWGGWVSKEDVTISKQTFRVVLYSLRRPSGIGQQFDIFFLGRPYFYLKRQLQCSAGRLPCPSIFPCSENFGKSKNKAGEPCDCGGVHTGAIKEIHMCMNSSVFIRNVFNQLPFRNMTQCDFERTGSVLKHDFFHKQ